MTDTVAGIFTAPLYLWQRELRERASLRVVVPAAVEPVTVDEAAEHLRIDAYGSPASPSTFMRTPTDEYPCLAIAQPSLAPDLHISSSVRRFICTSVTLTMS